MIVLILIQVSWWSLLPLAALAAGLALVYRSYTQFFRQHRTLTDMYELSRAVAASGQDGTLVDALLGRVRALMQAEYATLWLPAQGRHPEILLTARVEDSGLLDLSLTPPALREKVLETARPSRSAVVSPVIPSSGPASPSGGSRTRSSFRSGPAVS